ncbi:hypothetical protein MBRU_02120 [Mycolicibacterium brumae DSM 44177]|nr:hypothetical protein MBRU_02120 [Mycolicibacterium brumae DSM 44177]
MPQYAPWDQPVWLGYRDPAPSAPKRRSRLGAWLAAGAFGLEALGEPGA